VTARTPSGRIADLLAGGPRAPFRWTAFALAVTAFGAAIPTPLYPVYQQQLHFSSGVLGLVFAAYTPGVLLTLFFLAPQAERVGRRKLLYIGMGLTAVSAFVFALATGVLWLAAARAISGLAVGATTSVATAAMSDLEPYRDEHHVARVAVAANFGGFAAGVLFSGLLVQYAPGPVALVYLLPLAASAVGVFGIHLTPETAPALVSDAPVGIRRIEVPPGIRRSFWVAVGGVTACYSLYGLFAALVPTYIRTGLQISSPSSAGAIVALMFGVAAMTQLSTSQIRDRRALLIGFPLFLASLLALVLVLTLSSWALLLLVSAALGFAVGLTFMGSVTLVDRACPPAKRGEILAGFYSAGYLALSVPTVGVALASERIGLTAAGIAFASVLAVGVAFLYWGTYRTPTPPGGGGRLRAKGAGRNSNSGSRSPAASRTSK
jgi:MFS family permease